MITGKQIVSFSNCRKTQINYLLYCCGHVLEREKTPPIGCKILYQQVKIDGFNDHQDYWEISHRETIYHLDLNTRAEIVNNLVKLFQPHFGIDWYIKLKEAQQ